jgi:hypothetical protein
MMHNPISDIKAALHAATLHKQPFISPIPHV